MTVTTCTSRCAPTPTLSPDPEPNPNPNPHQACHDETSVACIVSALASPLADAKAAAALREGEVREAELRALATKVARVRELADKKRNIIGGVSLAGSESSSTSSPPDGEASQAEAPRGSQGTL